MSTHEPAPEYLPPVAPPGLGYVPEGYRPPEPERPARRLPWLWLTLGVVAIVAIAAGTTAIILGRRWDGRPSPGDVSITVRLTGADGDRPSAAALEQTKQIILSRMRQLDLTRPTVTAISADTLLVTAAHADAERARAVLVPGSLTFRKVLSVTTDHPGAACKADPQGRTDRAAALASAKSKLGATFDAAAAIKDPAEGQNLTGFDALTCAEIAALPPSMQYAVPAVTCAMLDGRPAGTLDDAAAQAAACDESGAKYLLDVAKVIGTDLAAAEAVIQKESGSWVVTLRFTAAGQPKWTALTKEAMDSGESSGQATQVAVLMDNEIVTAPTINDVISGDAQISGAGLATREGATALAATLSHGVLPLRLVITGIDTVR
ncbi:SecDF P1 head subdomain-containing protein [Dactylosporangium sp. CA-092794]|uniref:SecDF P1 head subdomain-containing protein n=1 Tax=Dactylosporangium sp. CA-092794 TaxID=3239929 RepID=UPI003D94FF83